MNYNLYLHLLQTHKLYVFECNMYKKKTEVINLGFFMVEHRGVEPLTS